MAVIATTGVAARLLRAGPKGNFLYLMVRANSKDAKVPRHHWLVLGLGALQVLFLFFAGGARADAIPPDQYACDGLGKQAGDACTTADGMPGRCQVSDGCAKKDLANWDRDASTYPPIVTYSCPKCVPAPDNGACGLAASSPAHRFAPWVIAATFSLLFLLARHRRRR